MIPKWTRWFDDQQLDEIFQIQLTIGHADTAAFMALREAIDPIFRATIATDDPPHIRLRKCLRRLNGVRNLVSGEIPFQKWLREARVLAAGQPEAAELDRYLRVFASGALVERPPETEPITAADASQFELELSLGEEPQTVSVQFLIGGATAARSVARLLVPRYGEGQPLINSGIPEYGKGTGWLIAPDLLITNYHVLEARDRRAGEDPPSSSDFELQARNAQVEFDYLTRDGRRTKRAVVELLFGDRKRDFALMRLAAEQGTERRPLRLSEASLIRPRGFKLSRRVNVLQHPDGEPMRLGFRDNFVLLGTDKILCYLTDTEAGSSGSPVLDDDWRVVALHCGYQALSKPITLRDHEIKFENFGIATREIIAALQAQRPDLFAEIAAAQGW